MYPGAARASLDARFIFLGIAFNAACAQETGEQWRSTERGEFKRSLNEIDNLDTPWDDACYPVVASS